jgi:predicted TIM-barrel enzyme
MDYKITGNELQAIANLVEQLPWKNANEIMDLLKAVVARQQKKPIEKGVKKKKPRRATL